MKRFRFLKQIYLGFDWWLPKNIYDMVKENVKSASMFVNNLCIAMYGVKTLVKSTLTGKHSNRSSKKDQANPERLDETKFYAMKSKFTVFFLLISKF